MCKNFTLSDLTPCTIHTISASPTQRKRPAVTAAIHSWAVESVETERAMQRPIKEVRALPTFSIRAFFTDRPQCSSTAKSPAHSSKYSQMLRQLTATFKFCLALLLTLSSDSACMYFHSLQFQQLIREQFFMLLS